MISKNLSLAASFELQLLCRSSLGFRSCSVDILRSINESKLIRPLMFQSMIEVNSGVWENAHEVRGSLESAIENLRCIGNSLGVVPCAGGSHAFADPRDAQIYPEEYFRKIAQAFPWESRLLQVSGLRIRIGMRSGEHAVLIANALTTYLPLLLALSSSSPFFDSKDSQMVSVRSSILGALPMGGFPSSFKSWNEFTQIQSGLARAGSICSLKVLGRDIRLNPSSGNIELGICDAPATLSEATAIVAFVHLLCLRLDRETSLNYPRQVVPDWLLSENKRRASRMGRKADLIVDPNGTTQNVRTVLDDLLDGMAPQILSHRYGRQMALLRRMAELGTSADRQRAKFAESGGNLIQVSKSLVAEFAADTPDWSANAEVRQNKSSKGGQECA